MDMYLS